MDKMFPHGIVEDYVENWSKKNSVLHKHIHKEARLLQIEVIIYLGTNFNGTKSLYKSQKREISNAFYALINMFGYHNTTDAFTRGCRTFLNVVAVEILKEYTAYNEYINNNVLLPITGTSIRTKIRKMESDFHNMITPNVFSLVMFMIECVRTLMPHFTFNWRDYYEFVANDYKNRLLNLNRIKMVGKASRIDVFACTIYSKLGPQAPSSLKLTLMEAMCRGHRNINDWGELISELSIYCEIREFSSLTDVTFGFELLSPNQNDE